MPLWPICHQRASTPSWAPRFLPAGLLDAYHLSDLQQYLQQYPASHYSHNGKEPLLYAVVLLLSLQFRCVDGRLLVCACVVVCGV